VPWEEVLKVLARKLASSRPMETDLEVNEGIEFSREYKEVK